MNPDLLIPPSQGRITLDHDGDLTDTIEVIKKAYYKSIPQMQELSRKLKGSSLKQSAQNVYDFIYTNIRYKRDTEGMEEVRTAARSWADREEGVDCEDMSIFGAALLTNMGYAPVFNIIAQNNSPFYSHIFVSVGTHNHSSNSLVKGYVIDPVPPLVGFDSIANNISKNMRIQLLEGVQDLNGLGCANPKSDMMLGLGGWAKKDAVTKALINRQSELLRMSRANPLNGPAGKRYRNNINAELRKNRFAIVLNGTAERDFVVDILPYVKDITTRGEYIFKPDAPINAINEYLSNAISLGLLENDEDLDGLEFDDLNDLGRKKKEERQQRKAEKKEDKEEKKQQKQAKKQEKKQVKQEKKQQKEEKKTGLRTIFKKKSAQEKAENKAKKVQKKAERKAKGPLLKRAAAKVKKIVKTAAKGIVKFNPVTIAMRNGMLAAFSLNLFKLSSKLKSGYLTEAQARELNLNLDEWRKVVEDLRNTEKIFTGMGGESKNLRSAIIKGGKGFGILSGYDEDWQGDINGALAGLGVLPATAAPAAGIIAKIVAMLKRINFKKLIGAAKTVAPEIAAELLSDEAPEPGDVKADQEGFANQEEKAAFEDTMKAEVAEGGGDPSGDSRSAAGDSSNFTNVNTGDGGGEGSNSSNKSSSEGSESGGGSGSSPDNSQMWLIGGGMLALAAIAFIATR